MGGRPVFDGGGIKPDVAIDNLPFLKILNTLNKDLYVFNFASSYKAKHASIAKASDFKLTDADFDDFLKFLKEQGYTYKTATEILLEQLEAQAASEAYEDAMEEELNGIKAVLSESRQGELKKQKDANQKLWNEIEIL